MHTDPIADLLTRIRNAQNAHHQSVEIPYSKVKENIVKILKDKKFIEDYEVEGEGVLKAISVSIIEDQSPITLKRVSKPGQRIYVKSAELKAIKSGLGISIISTSKGLMTNAEARRQKLGGELLCEIY